MIDGVLVLAEADLGESTRRKYRKANHIESKGPSKLVTVVLVAWPNQQCDTA